MNATPDKKDQIYRGIIHACLAFFCFTAMQALGKIIKDVHGATEIAFYRNLIAIIPLIGFMVIYRRYDILKTAVPWLLTSRVVIGTIGLVLTFAAMQALPMSNATVLFFASTIMTPIFSFLFLKEHVGPHRWIAVAIGMTGVIVVAQPTAQMSLIGIALALGAATVHAIIQVMIRGMKNEHPMTITFYFFLGGIIMIGPALPWVGHWPTAETLPYILGIGVLGGFGQYFLTTGFQMAPASLLSPFNYTGLLWATVFDVMIWSYIPGWPVFVGSGIILAAKIYIIQRERRVSKIKKQAENKPLNS